MTLNYLIWLFVKPSHLVFLLLIVGIVLWPLRVGRWCRNAGAILIVLLGLSPVGSLALHALESRFERPDVRHAIDGIIVLAGFEAVGLSEVYGQPQLTAAGDRLTTFLTLANRFPDARLAHSGWFDETAVTAPLVLGSGIAPERVLFDDQSRNTCASASTLKAALDPAADETWLLVTSAAHLPRAVACFRARGFDVTPYPADYRTGPNPFHFGLLKNLAAVDMAAHEWLGLLYYRLTRRTNSVFPAG